MFQPAVEPFPRGFWGSGGVGQDVDGLCVNVSACCWTVPCGFWGSGGGVGQDVDGLCVNVSACC